MKNILLLLLLFTVTAMGKGDKIIKNMERWQIGAGIEGISGFSSTQFAGVNGKHQFDTDLLFGTGFNFDLTYSLNRWFALYGVVGGSFCYENRTDYAYPEGDYSSTDHSAEQNRFAVTLKFGGQFLIKRAFFDFYTRIGLIGGWGTRKYKSEPVSVTFSNMMVGGDLELGFKRKKFDLYLGVSYLHHITDPSDISSDEAQFENTYEGYDLPIYLGLRYNFLTF